MDRRKWLWKRSSERSSGETESSESISSLSERSSNEKETLKESPNNNTQSPEVTSKAARTDDQVNESVKSLTEKLSAALANVGAKEDLVKQHSKVAEEAVAGWEKAENEITALKQQLEASIQQNLALEVRASHLDGALKECVRQLRQAKEDHEHIFHDAVVAKTNEWESIKTELENKILELQTHAEASKAGSAAHTDPNICLKLEFLEKENSVLKAELLSLSEELEVRTIERELSTQAAETASKQQLESIKKVAKLEAECRRLQAIVRKSSSINNHKSISASLFYAESLTDSQSGTAGYVNAVDIDTYEKSKSDQFDSQPSCSDSWASALISELEQFKTEKDMNRNVASYSVEIDMMDDFLEMEQLAALFETNKMPYAESCMAFNKPTNEKNSKKARPETTTSYVAELEEKLIKIKAEKAELESRISLVSELEEKLITIEAEKAELETMTSCMAELEDKLVKLEVEKAELEKALNDTRDSLKASQAQLREAANRLEELQKELAVVNESKEVLKFQLIGMEGEAQNMAANVSSLKVEVEKKKTSSAEMAARCQKLENELKRNSQEAELQQTAISNTEQKTKQEDFAVAADKLAECQRTIVSLGRQLQSLATLEDFLIETANLPGFSGARPLIPRAHEESVLKLHSDDALISISDSDPSKTPLEIASRSLNKNDGESPASSSSSSSSSSRASSSKSRNGFGKLFSRSKGAVQLENHRG